MAGLLAATPPSMQIISWPASPVIFMGGKYVGAADVARDTSTMVGLNPFRLADRLRNTTARPAFQS